MAKARRKNGRYVATWSLHFNPLTRKTVYLNGRKIPYPVRAKSGHNGFVEFFDPPLRTTPSGEVVSKALRGNVKVVVGAFQ